LEEERQDEAGAGRDVGEHRESRVADEAACGAVNGILLDVKSDTRCHWFVRRC
jgi:hypothetical protein